MFVGPVFSREIAIAPRRLRIYLARSTYVAGLLLLVFTAWMVMSGKQEVRDVGDLARFGAILFQILAPLQMAWAVFFSAILAASAVAHEKDRKTLILLLLTRLTNSELVLGKLFASLLSVVVMLLAAVPLFFALAMLGGISLEQIGRVFAVTFASVLVSGSLGSLIALWREKTFQALAITVLALVLWIALGESIASGVWGTTFGNLSCQSIAISLSPWRAILEASQPWLQSDPNWGTLFSPLAWFLTLSVGAAFLINLAAIALVRVWNPSREALPRTEAEDRPAQESIFDTEDRLEQIKLNQQGASSAWSYSRRTEEPGTTAEIPSASASSASSSVSRRHPRTRTVWDNPILWREIRTWAYGRKILLVRFAYLVLFALAAAGIHALVRTEQLTSYAQGAVILVPLFLLSLILVNAQAVTSLTSERDAKALDLLLVTDLSPREIVFGKLGGIFFNTKEMVVLPILLCVSLWWTGTLGLENLIFLVGGLLVMYVFVAVLGLHAGITYGNSGSAIATSLGTVFFLTVGVAACMRIMLAFSGSFEAQFVPFFAYMVLGGAGLYLVLGARNPSGALGVASFLCPFATFYAITSYLLEANFAMFLSLVAAYGFTTAAMLVPALFEFDIATGKASLDE